MARKEDGWLSLRISETEKQELEAVAEANERTLNGQVRLYIREGLERERTPTKVAA